MDLSKLQDVLECAPRRNKALAEEIKKLQGEQGALAFFADAVDRLKISWGDGDPGKHAAYWSCFHEGRPAWPRELVDAKAVEAHVRRHRIAAPHWKDYDVRLAPLAELAVRACPGCGKDGLLARCQRQTYDSPGGDEWARIDYVLCAECPGAYEIQRQVSDTRF